MANIKDITTLMGLIDGGGEIAQINQAYNDLINLLRECSLSTPKRAFKGSVKIELSFAVKDGLAEITMDHTIKEPKIPKRPDILWPTADGFLTDQHPKQINMFPTGVNRSLVNGVVSEDQDNSTDDQSNTG